jgi:hypothetical protein
MKSTKVTSEKEIAQNKINVIDLRKNQIKNSENSIFENTDFLNLEKKISALKVKEKISIDRQKMYKFESTINDLKELKKQRSKMRNIRNRYANNIILQFQKKNEIELKKEVKEFKDFYLQNYVLNDYSLLSISSNNRDKETELILNSMLEIIKLIK